MVSINSLVNLNTTSHFNVFESSSKSSLNKDPSEANQTTGKNLKPIGKRSYTTSPRKKGAHVLSDISWRGDTSILGKELVDKQNDIFSKQFSISEFVGSMPNIKPKPKGRRPQLDPLGLNTKKPNAGNENSLEKAKEALFPKAPFEQFHNTTMQNFNSFYSSNRTTQMGSTGNTPWQGASNMSSFYSPSVGSGQHRRVQSHEMKGNPAILPRTISYRAPGGQKKVPNSLLDYIMSNKQTALKTKEDTAGEEIGANLSETEIMPSVRDRDKMMDQGKFTVYLESLKGESNDLASSLNKRTFFKKILDEKEELSKAIKASKEEEAKKAMVLPDLRFQNRSLARTATMKRKDDERTKNNSNSPDAKKFHQISRTSIELEETGKDLSGVGSMASIKRVSIVENPDNAQRANVKSGKNKEGDQFPRQVSYKEELVTGMSDQKDLRPNKLIENRKSIRERYSFKKTPTLIIPKEESLELSWNLSERLMEKLKILFEINSNKNKTFNDVKKLIDQIEILQNAFLSPHGSHFNPNLTATSLQKFLVTEPPKFAHESIIKTFQIKLHVDNIRLFEEFDQRVNDYIFSKKIHKLKLSEQELISRFCDYKKTQRKFLRRYKGDQLKEMREFIKKESGGVLEGVRNSDFPLMDQVEKFEKKFGDMNHLEKEKRVFGKKIEESIIAIIDATNKDESLDFGDS